MDKEYPTLDAFFPFYLSQHSNRINRRLHFIGTILATLQLIRTLLFAFSLPNLILTLFIGYGFAWVGHFFFEKNKPATFKYPWLSFQGDFRMFKEIATGKIPF